LGRELLSQAAGKPWFWVAQLLFSQALKKPGNAGCAVEERRFSAA
jgi:hypothetical protein